MGVSVSELNTRDATVCDRRSLSGARVCELNTGDATVSDRRSLSGARVSDRYLWVLGLRSGLPFILIPTEQNLQLSPEVHPRHGVEKEVNAVVEAEDGFGDVEGSTEVGWAGRTRPCCPVAELAEHPHTPNDKVREVEGDKTSWYHQQQTSKLQLHRAWCVIRRKPAIQKNIRAFPQLTWFSDPKKRISVFELITSSVREREMLLQRQENTVSKEDL